MIRIIYLIACMVCLQHQLSAQLVSIPDDKFRAFLQNKYPGCFQGQQLDIQCPEVLAADSLVINVDRILDYDGLQYLVNLQNLNIEVESFGDIELNSENLPPNLIELLVLGIPLDPDIDPDYEPLFLTVNSPPSTLKRLTVSGRIDFESVFTIVDLQEGLSYIEAVEPVFITNFPSSLDTIITTPYFDMPPFPANLKVLELIGIGFFEDPLPSLPSTLKRLYIDNLLLENPLPPLPEGLLELIIIESDAVNASTIIPSTLNVFQINGSELTELPDLPNNLSILDVNLNELTQLPFLPAKLVTLRAQSNKLVKLPPLPASLRTLDVSRNPTLACLPPLPDSLQNLNFTGAQFICIPNTTVFINTTPNRPLCTDSSRICKESQPLLGGKVFLDVNKNGVFDGTDKPVRNAVIQLEGSDRYATTQSDGSYILLGNAGISNTFMTTYSNPYLEQIAPVSYTIIPSGGGLQGDTFNFAIRLQAVQDLELVIANSFARPGFATTAWVTVQNRGGLDVNNATLQFVKPTTWTLQETSPTISSTSGDTLIWTGLNLPVGSSQVFLIRTELPATATILGNPYTYWARILPIQNDQTPNNNVVRRIDTIRGAYDPNDKLVDQQTLSPAYTPDTELTYTIRFQNTGTDTAFKVVVTDTILSKLKPESIRVISASHAFEFELDEGGIAVFTFDDILLPDSNVNEPASHGYVMLALKPEAGLAMNDVIENEASIFFDFNEPIITNTAQTTIKVVSNISAYTSQSLLVFPNPVSDKVRVVWPFEQPVVLNVLDMSGRQVFSARYTQPFAEVDLGSMNKGMYIIQVATEESVAIAKVIVK